MILESLSKILSQVVDAREFLYKKNILKSYAAGVPVISVGNLTFGGTGKTPTCDFLIKNLKNKKKIALLSRGYRRTTRGFLKVDATQMYAAQLYGDEPTWLAKQHPDVPVYVCEDRVKGCQEILKDTQVDLILADDAFQHLRLKRDFDIVVIDATEDLKNYEYPPLGRARNSWDYLERANCIFLTKTNLADKQKIAQLKEKFPKNLPVFEFASQITGFYEINNREEFKNSNTEVYLLSGIGKPWTFEQLVKEKYSFKILKHFIFKDHAHYTEELLNDLAKEVAGTPILVTQKDAVKLKNRRTRLKLFESFLEFQPLSPMDTFYELISK